MPPFRRTVISCVLIYAVLSALYIPLHIDGTVEAQLGEDLGEIVFQSNRDGDFEIYVMNGEGGEVRQLTNNIEVDVRPKWSPDGSKIAFISGRDNHASFGENMSLYVMDADGENVRRLSSDDIRVTDFYFNWSPDGSKIAFAFDPNYVFDSYSLEMEIYIVDLESSEINQVTDTEWPSAGPVWSPDSSQIAFLSFVGEPSGARFPDLFVVDVESETVRRLTEGSASDMNPTWSSTGTEILFISYGGNGANIIVADLDNDTLTSVTDMELGDSFNPQWSPDENQIVFEIRFVLENRTELALMDSGGDSYHVLAENRARSFGADWSPDGSKLVYVSDSDDDSELYIVNPDATGNKQLTDNEYADESPDWRPSLE